jgi:hypothetical protein
MALQQQWQLSILNALPPGIQIFQDSSQSPLMMLKITKAFLKLPSVRKKSSCFWKTKTFTESHIKSAKKRWELIT